MARGIATVANPLHCAGLKKAIRDIMALYAKALAGDMVFVVTPATDTPAPTAAVWTQDFYVEVQSAAGEVHTWFNKAVASGVAVSDTSTAGTATIPSTTLTFTDGVASVTMSGDAADWLNGETATLTVAALSVMGYTLAQKTGVLTFTTP
jgi:hypothetical protein